MRHPHKQTPQQHSPRPRRRGFTMIELMIVLMILSILVAMVVGIGNYVAEEQNRKQTRVYQEIILGAIDRYTHIHGSAPGGSGSDVSARIRDLARDLAKDPDCAEILTKLPKSAYSKTVGGGTFSDAYGQELDWYPAGSMGNGPLLVSAGADGDFGHGDGGRFGYLTYSEKQLKAQKDNIRSDDRTRD